MSSRLINQSLIGKRGRGARTWLAGASVFVFVIAVSTVWSASTQNIFISVHTAMMLLLLTLTATMEWRRSPSLPFLLSPGTAVVASVIVGSIAAFQFSNDDYAAYLQLWVLQGLGLIIGLVSTQVLRGGGLPIGRIRDKGTFISLASLVAIFGLISATVFFAVHGVPALSGNVEQGRVDAAAEGTGYLRLVAYLMIPASLLLVAAKARYCWLWLFLTLAVVLGLANRSPLVYLFVPLLFLAFSREKVKVTSFRIVFSAALVLTAVVGVGAFRIFSQDEFANYEEYRDDLAEGDYVGVAMTSLEHYSGVVADNAVLSKGLVDSGALPHQWGTSYLTLFISALPGEQLSLDRLIKETTGKTFIGGGTPPTLMGEGYINFGPIGTIVSAAVVILLVRRWADRYSGASASGRAIDKDVLATIYGYIVTWACLSQVAGLAGASTFPLAGALTLWLLWHFSQTKLHQEGKLL